MKFIHLLFVVLLLLISCGILDTDEPSNVITFSHTIDRSIISTAISVFQTPDSGFILLGTIDSADVSQSFALTKIDKNGNVVTTQEIRSSESYWLMSATEAIEGNFVFLGRSIDYEDPITTVLITDIMGNILSENNYQIGSSENISQTSNGAFIIVGTTYSVSSSNYSDITYSKIGADGNLDWSKTKVSEGSDRAVVSTDAIGGGTILLVRLSDSLGTSLLKIDDDGNELWWRSIDVRSPLWLEITSDDAYVIAGSNFEPTLIKTDQNAQQAWSNSYKGFSNYGGKIFQQTFDGGYIIGAETSGLVSIGFPPPVNIKLIKVDSNGKEQWNRTFGGDSDDWVRSVIQTSDGGYLILGQTTSFGEYDSQVWLIKTGPDGRL